MRVESFAVQDCLLSSTILSFFSSCPLPPGTSLMSSLHQRQQRLPGKQQSYNTTPHHQDHHLTTPQPLPESKSQSSLTPSASSTAGSLSLRQFWTSMLVQNCRGSGEVKPVNWHRPLEWIRMPLESRRNNNRRESSRLSSVSGFDQQRWMP